MRKLFTEPVMEINVFDVENIVTSSTSLQGEPVDLTSINDSNNAIIKADWSAEGSSLTFTF